MKEADTAALKASKRRLFAEVRPADGPSLPSTTVPVAPLMRDDATDIFELDCFNGDL